MRRRLRLVAFLAIAASGTCAHAQADGCQGAYDALNRVKEEITPDLTPVTDAGRLRLEKMLRTLENGSHVCVENVPEMWAYREMVGRHLGTPDGLKSARWAHARLEELKYTPRFDAFSPPPVAVPAGASAVHPIRKKWALVVGINQFADPDVPRLHYASKDAKDFVEFLEDPASGGFARENVRLLVDGEATLQHIREGLAALEAQAQEDDLVVVFISSHGSPRSLAPNGLSYIIASDTRVDTPEHLFSGSLQMIDLVQTINREIRAKRAVLFLDTCYSGAAQSETGNDGQGSKAITRVWDTSPPPQAPSSQGYSAALTNLHFGYGRAVITASRADERSWESDKLQNGYFTHYLLSVLRESASKSLDGLFPAVKSSVASTVEHEKGVPQTPTSQFSDGGGSIILTSATGGGAGGR